MNRLKEELRRLNLLLEGDPANGTVTRIVVLGFARAADWAAAARLHRSVQEAFEFPPPLVSIVAGGGYRLWFPLAEPVAVDVARAFLTALHREYLSDLPPGCLEGWPAAGPDFAACDPAQVPPVLDEALGKWSAFIDADLGSLFADEPGLDMAPSDERQADLLAGIASIQREVFERALARLSASGETAGADAPNDAVSASASFTNPKAFLLAVMNDPAVGIAHRIEAAKALLPWFER